MNTVILSITISVFALLVTLVNAATGIANFVLSRVRLLAVREIECGTTQRANVAQSSRHFTVDVISYGAAIWDMEVQVEIKIPDTRRNIATGSSGTIILGLKPRGDYTNPLNAGQGMIWEMWSHEMLIPEFRDHLYKCLPDVPHRNISLCIYCSQKRKLLRRIRHPLFHWRLDDFLENRMKVRLPRYQTSTWRGRIGISSDPAVES
jgi:hypothetical protein